MAIFEPSDLFVVQRVTGDSAGHYSVAVQDMEAHFESSPAVFFRGAVNLTISQTGQLQGPDGDIRNNGDLYVNDTAGTVYSDWPGISGESTNVGDRIVWDDDPGVWILIKDVAGTGTLTDVSGVEPIQVSKGQGSQPIPGGSETEPIISIKDATTSTTGSAMQAEASDFSGDGVDTRDGHPLFVTPKQVMEYGGSGGVDPDNDARYVEVAGDNMTGNLTFDTDKIELKTDGSAKFANTVASGSADFTGPYTYISSGGLGVMANSSTTKAAILPDGSADFAGGDTVITDSGNVKCGDFDDDVGSFIGSAGTIAVRKDGGGSADVMLGVYNGGTTAGSLVSRVNGDGSADFAGRVNAGGSSADPVQNEPGLAAYNDDGGTTATIFGNNLDSSGTGRLLELRSNNVAKVIVGADGSVTFSGNISGGEGANFSGGIVSNFRGSADQYCFGAGQVSVDGPGLNSENAWITADGSATFSGFVDVIREANNLEGYLGIGPGDDKEKAMFLNRNNAIELHFWSDYSTTPNALISSAGDILLGGVIKPDYPDDHSPNTVLNADGSATFEGEVEALTLTTDLNGSGVYALRSLGGSAEVFRGGLAKDNITSRITADGSATFSAKVETIGEEAAVHIGIDKDSNKVPLNIFDTANGSTPLARINGDGSATFGAGVQIGTTNVSNSDTGGFLYATRFVDDSNKGSAALCSEDSGVLYGLQVIDRSSGAGVVKASIDMDGAADFATAVTIGSSTAYSGTKDGWAFRAFVYRNGNALAAYYDDIHTTPSAPYFLRCQVSGGDTVSIRSDGTAEFAGTVTANGTILTRSSGTLDVGDRLEKVDAALQSLKTAVTANSTLDELRAAIISALTDV